MPRLDITLSSAIAPNMEPDAEGCIVSSGSYFGLLDSVIQRYIVFHGADPFLVSSVYSFGGLKPSGAFRHSTVVMVAVLLPRAAA
jgi:hypothetical protein